MAQPTLVVRSHTLKRAMRRHGFPTAAAFRQAAELKERTYYDLMSGRKTPTGATIAAVLYALPGATFEELFEVADAPQEQNAAPQPATAAPALPIRQPHAVPAGPRHVLPRPGFAPEVTAATRQAGRADAPPRAASPLRERRVA